MRQKRFPSISAIKLATALKTTWLQAKTGPTNIFLVSHEIMYISQVFSHFLFEHQKTKNAIWLELVSIKKLNKAGRSTPTSICKGYFRTPWGLQGLSMRSKISLLYSKKSKYNLSYFPEVSFESPLSTSPWQLSTFFPIRNSSERSC